MRARRTVTVKSAGLVLHDAFHSLDDAAAFHSPWLPVRLLLRSHYDDAAKIGRVAVPLLVIHSPQDEAIPFEQGRALFDAAAEPKELLVTAGSHNGPSYLAKREWQARAHACVERALPRSGLDFVLGSAGVVPALAAEEARGLAG